MSSESECLPSIGLVWRRAAEIRLGWSAKMRANRRRKAKVLLRRIGLDESLLPPVAPQYHPGDRRYRWAKSIQDQERLAHRDRLPAKTDSSKMQLARDQARSRRKKRQSAVTRSSGSRLRSP